MRAPRDLRQLSFVTFCRAIPDLHKQFVTSIPDEFFTMVDGEAAVDCPCGSTPAVPYAVPTECDCDRWFLYDGAGVRVARFAADTAEV